MISIAEPADLLLPSRVRRMDEEALLAAVNRWLDLIDAVRAVPTSTAALQRSYGREARQRLEELDDELVVLKDLLAPAYRHLLDEPPGGPFHASVMTTFAKGVRWEGTRSDAIRLRGVLKNRKMNSAILGPTGPRMAAADLHPWVWNAAATRWDNGDRRAALQAAGSAVEHKTQVKTGRMDLQGEALFREVFSTSAPASSRPRLRRLPGQPSERTWEAAHQGAIHLGQGCMMGIRNLVSHGDPQAQPGREEAFEALAALSLLARWVDEARILKVD